MVLAPKSKKSTRAEVILRPMREHPDKIALVAAGAGMMFLLDPDRGRRRRALLRDRLIRYGRRLGRPADVIRKDLTNRTLGLLAEARGRFTEGEVDDVVLVERVKSRIGSWLGHPRSIEVAVQDGQVTLTGPVLASEVDRLVRAVSHIRGVRGVKNRLEVHEQPGNVPGLQGGTSRRGGRPELLQEYWSPAARFIAACASVYGLLRRDLPGAITLEKDIVISAPIERVYGIWSNLEHFPKFMSHVHEVREIGDGRSHWVVDGPGGVPIEWDAVLTRVVPLQIIAWKTEEGSLIQHSGIVRFDPTDGGGTRVEVRLSYNPGLGGLGHAVAWLFRGDPKAQMDDDLMRMKSFMETAIPPSDAAAA